MISMKDMTDTDIRKSIDFHKEGIAARKERFSRLTRSLANLKSARNDEKVRIAASRKRIAELESWLAERAKTQVLPEPDDVTNIISFRKQFDRFGTVYAYAAIRTNGLWYLTGAKSPQGITWTALSEFIEKDNIAAVMYRNLAAQAYVTNSQKNPF